MTLHAYFVKKENVERITEMNNGNPPAPSTLKKPTYFIEATEGEDEGNHFISAPAFLAAYKWHCGEDHCRIVEPR